MSHRAAALRQRLKDRDLNSSSRHCKVASGKVLPLEIFEESLFKFLSMVEFRTAFWTSGSPENRSINATVSLSAAISRISPAG
jgi:hypothetical protein